MAPIIDAVEARVQSQLRASLPPLAPAVVVTIYPSNGARAAALACRPLLERLRRAAAPGDLAVCVHDPINGDEKPVTDLVRDLSLRLWVAWGANPHVRTARSKGPAAALDVCARWSAAAHALGAEVVELNGERVGSGNAEDWVIDAPGDAALLPGLAASLIATARASAPGCRVSWTSHDAPRWHKLPWAAILGAGAADLHGPQIYPANPGTPGQESVGAARARLAMAVGQWEALVAAGTVRADLGPGGAGWCAYTQAHGVSLAGCALILDSSNTSRAWALPTRCDADGIGAIEAVLTARRLHGRSAGAIKRAQAAAGLTVDGVCGPRTLAALGLS